MRKPLLLLAVMAAVGVPAWGGPDTAGYDLDLDLSDAGFWTIDLGHLGTSQMEISYDAEDEAAVITPAWSASDRDSDEIGVRNVENSRLHFYQLIESTDCTQADSYLEISVPQEYIDEGKLELVFALQADKEGDFLFNGRTFTMDDFADDGGEYKQLIVTPPDFNEPPEKLRAIQRVGFVLKRRNSMVSAPIKVRRMAIDLNSERVTPPAEEVRVKNPRSFYEFTYTAQADVDGFHARVSEETMDITIQLNDAGDGLALIPHWAEGQIPAGHTGDVCVYQSLGAPHDFDAFEVQYVLSIPRAYFDEAKLDLYLFIQAGEAGHYVWSGTQRPPSSFADKAGQDVVLTMTEEDVRAHGKKRTRIETVGLQLNRHGSTVTEPLTLKSITITLPEQGLPEGP